MQNTEAPSDLRNVPLSVKLLLIVVVVVLVNAAATSLGLETDPFTLRGTATLLPGWLLLDYLFEHIGRKFGYRLGISLFYPGNWQKS